MKTKLVGILNSTPDSFSDGGKYSEVEKAIEHASSLFDQGASIVDVGGEATNPWAPELSWEEEWSRLDQLLPKLLEMYPGKISLDTRHARTAENFLRLGGTILNDVSGFINQEMIVLAAQHQPICIVNHFPAASPKLVHKQEIDDIAAVRGDLLAKAEEMIALGVKREQIVLDPGIGFGKTMQLNRELLSFASIVPDYPVMIGHSKKRFLGENRMEIEPNLEAARIAIASGAAYLRIHDVAAHAQLLQ